MLKGFKKYVFHYGTPWKVKAKAEPRHHFTLQGSIEKVTSPRSLHCDVHVTQMALAALDNVSRRGQRGTGGSALPVVPQAALLLDCGTVYRPHGREALLASAALVTLARAAFAHARLLSESRSASRRLFCVCEETDRAPRSSRSNMARADSNEMAFSQIGKDNTKISTTRNQ